EPEREQQAGPAHASASRRGIRIAPPAMPRPGRQCSETLPHDGAPGRSLRYACAGRRGRHKRMPGVPPARPARGSPAPGPAEHLPTREEACIGDTFPSVRAAVVQAAPVFLEREATLAKVARLAESAAE